MSCDPERVTAYVDGELEPAAAAMVAAHVETCAGCRAQAAEERTLRARLRSLPPPELPPGLEARVRRGARRRPFPALRWALPVAAALALAFWLRGHPPFVAWDLARDHAKCFSRHPVPAKVWGAEPSVVAAWFLERGTHLPAVPPRVGDVELVGARYCPLAGVSFAPHVYYASGEKHVSLFVVPQGVRVRDRFAGEAGGRAVRLVRLEGEVVGIVGEREADVQAFETALRPLLASRVGATLPEDGMDHAR